MQYPKNITTTSLSAVIRAYSPLCQEPDLFYATIFENHTTPAKLLRKLNALPFKQNTNSFTTNQINDIFYDVYQLDMPTDEFIDVQTIAMDCLNKFIKSTTTPTNPQPYTLPNPLPTLVPTEQHSRIDGGYLIDVPTWERRGNYAFFTQHKQKWMSICSQLSCGNTKQHAKENNESLFIRSLYAVLRAINETKEFRYRLDMHGRVVLWDKIDAIAPIAAKSTGNFVTSRFPYVTDYNEFAIKAKEVIARVDQTLDPYAEEEILDRDGKYDVVLLSSMPQLSFTAVTSSSLRDPVENAHYPYIHMGKMDKDFNQIDTVPVSIYFCHSFADGGHCAAWLKLLSAYLQDPSV